MGATVNLFSGQQADIENGDLSGFFPGSGVTLSQDASQSVHGAASLKVTTDGGGTFQQLEVRIPVAGQFTAGGVYAFSAYIYGTGGAVGRTLRYYCQSNTGNIGAVGTITLLAGWNRYSFSVTLPNPIVQTYFALRWDTGGVAQALTLWMDCLQVQAGGTLTPWVPGGGLPINIYMAYIAGQPVDVVKGSMHVETQIGQRSTGGVQVWSRLGVSYKYGTQIQVYNDQGALAFAGYTTKDKVTKNAGARQGTGHLIHNLQLMDNAYKADKRRAFGGYLNQSAGSIVLSLLNKILVAEGVTATASSIAAGTTVIEAVWNYNKSVAEAIQWLATQSGYWWLIDLNNVLWFQPYGGTPAPFVLDGTQVDSVKQLSCEYGNDMYVNSEYVKGSYQEKGSKKNPLHETFHGNGSTRSFALSYNVSTLRQVLLNGSDVTANSLTKGSTGGEFYYAQGDPIIAQDPSFTVLGSGDTLDIYYTGRIPVIANAKNGQLITAQRAREGGGTGLVESAYSSTKVKTQAAAFSIASALLAHYGQDTTLLTFATRQTGLAPGQMLTVNLLDYDGLTNKQMLIKGVTISDQVDGHNVWFVVQAVGSPVESAQWQTYWQNLMNQSSDPSDLTDIQSESALSLLLAGSVNMTLHIAGSVSKHTCPICGNATICAPGLLIC